MKKTILLIAMSIIIISLSPLSLFAHKLNIYAYTDGDMVNSESYFADGSRCKNCIIEVYEKNTGKTIIEGKTDDNGKFSFKMPEAASLRLVLKAGAGHQSEYNLSLKEAAGTRLKEETKDTKRLKDGISKEVQDKASHLDKQKCLSSEDIEAVVSQAIDRKLQPLMNQIALMHQEIGKAGIMEIIGGIGYIIGIMGIIMYFKSRKNMGK